jgi:hypothetical protein
MGMRALKISGSTSTNHVWGLYRISCSRVPDFGYAGLSLSHWSFYFFDQSCLVNFTLFHDSINGKERYC